MELSKDCVITLNEDENTCLTGLESRRHSFCCVATICPAKVMLFLNRTEWSKEYNDSVCDERAAKVEIEGYVALYDRSINERIAREKAADEDGWTTVTGRKKRGQFAPTRKESTIGKVLQKEEQRRKKKQLLNFYTFQIREAKKQSRCICELRCNGFPNG